MSNNAETQSGRFGIMGLLGVLFVGLKLTGYINWSWWWVTAPFWGGLAVFGVIAIVAFVIFGGIELLK